MSPEEKLEKAKRLIKNLHDFLWCLLQEPWDYDDCTIGAFRANIRYCEEALGLPLTRLLMERGEVKPLMFKEQL